MVVRKMLQFLPQVVFKSFWLMFVLYSLAWVPCDIEAGYALIIIKTVLIWLLLILLSLRKYFERIALQCMKTHIKHFILNNKSSYFFLTLFIPQQNIGVCVFLFGCISVCILVCVWMEKILWHYPFSLCVCIRESG